MHTRLTQIIDEAWPKRSLTKDEENVLALAYGAWKYALDEESYRECILFLDYRTARVDRRELLCHCLEKETIAKSMNRYGQRVDFTFMEVDEMTPKVLCRRCSSTYPMSLFVRLQWLDTFTAPFDISLPSQIETVSGWLCCCEHVRFRQHASRLEQVTNVFDRRYDTFTREYIPTLHHDFDILFNEHAWFIPPSSSARAHSVASMIRCVVVGQETHHADATIKLVITQGWALFYAQRVRLHVSSINDHTKLVVAPLADDARMHVQETSAVSKCIIMDTPNGFFINLFVDKPSTVTLSVSCAEKSILVGYYDGASNDISLAWNRPPSNDMRDPSFKTTLDELGESLVSVALPRSKGEHCERAFGLLVEPAGCRREAFRRALDVIAAPRRINLHPLYDSTEMLRSHMYDSTSFFLRQRASNEEELTLIANHLLFVPSVRDPTSTSLRAVVHIGSSPFDINVSAKYWIEKETQRMFLLIDYDYVFELHPPTCPDCHTHRHARTTTRIKSRPAWKLSRHILPPQIRNALDVCSQEHMPGGLERIFQLLQEALGPGYTHVVYDLTLREQEHAVVL